MLPRLRAAPLAVLLAVAAPGCGGEQAPLARPNLLLITLDTTRPDRLGLYGYERNTSPSLDALARDSVVYTRARSTTSWTLPAHASLFTGKFTASHGARFDPHGPLKLLDAIEGRPVWSQFRARGLSRDGTTLAELVGEAGYATGAVVAGPWMKRVFGLDRGFEHYDDSEISSVSGRLAPGVTHAAIAWLEEVGDRPFFLFLNYYDPHGPLNPPRRFVRAVAPEATDSQLAGGTDPQVQSMFYDGEIRFMDHHLGRLLDFLKQRGLYEDTWILVTADHGELLGERGMRGHGKFLTEEELRIPFIVKLPRDEGRPGRDDAPIQLTDVLPWVAKRLGLEAPADIQGQAPPGLERPVLAEVYPVAAASRRGSWRAFYDGDLKYLWNSKGDDELYDLAKDPERRQNLAAREPRRAEAMRQRLQGYLDGLPRPGRPLEPLQVDAETREALESLGYIDPEPAGEGGER